eukprot:CAMPEP_0197680462 /NCGR_PEP_ID=MMETSP1338-20131121/93374_1 /TAXON_ID=43686 ORGANISM="Pelagodinium beii, Strain RCC1491" /NCGR_SAMPLE_ID=MMETSP1338 /ASSEMBLY_ACC=CAM_ASM_000754 /LENGTH=121 /DNA_ID=CAMNT_0043261645 /DNA_START=185 /DNA_END=551 /DNA_ORIENTATION=-
MDCFSSIRPVPVKHARWCGNLKKLDWCLKHNNVKVEEYYFSVRHLESSQLREDVAMTLSRRLVSRCGINHVDRPNLPHSAKASQAFTLEEIKSLFGKARPTSSTRGVPSSNFLSLLPSADA